jgi:hypothetical protein
LSFGVFQQINPLPPRSAPVQHCNATLKHASEHIVFKGVFVLFVVLVSINDAHCKNFVFCFAGGWES